MFVLLPVERMYQLKASTNISKVQTLRGELTQKKRKSGDVMKWNQTRMKSNCIYGSHPFLCEKQRAENREQDSLFLYVEDKASGIWSWVL